MDRLKKLQAEWGTFAIIVTFILGMGFKAGQDYAQFRALSQQNAEFATDQKAQWDMIHTHSAELAALMALQSKGKTP